MINPYKKQIDELTQITFQSICREDYFSANLEFDKLSLLYMEEFIFYFNSIGKKKTLKEKKEIHKELSSRLKEWRRMADIRKRISEIEHAERIYTARLDFQNAIDSRDFSLADEQADRLSVLYFKGEALYSEHICELEKRIADTNNPSQKQEFEKRLANLRKTYSKINEGWTEIRIDRRLCVE